MKLSQGAQTSQPTLVKKVAKIFCVRVFLGVGGIASQQARHRAGYNSQIRQGTADYEALHFAMRKNDRKTVIGPRFI
jgi:hypothetical protein